MKLFPAEIALNTVENTEMTFREPSLYWDTCGPFSLVVSKGHIVDPLPGESGYRIIFSISLFTGSGADDEEMMESESEELEATDSGSGENLDWKAEAIREFGEELGPSDNEEEEESSDVEVASDVEEASDVEMS